MFLIETSFTCGQWTQNMSNNKNILCMQISPRHKVTVLGVWSAVCAQFAADFDVYLINKSPMQALICIQKERVQGERVREMERKSNGGWPDFCLPRLSVGISDGRNGQIYFFFSLGSLMLCSKASLNCTAYPVGERARLHDACRLVGEELVYWRCTCCGVEKVNNFA